MLSGSDLLKPTSVNARVLQAVHKAHLSFLSHLKEYAQLFRTLLAIQNLVYFIYSGVPPLPVEAVVCFGILTKVAFSCKYYLQSPQVLFLSTDENNVKVATLNAVEGIFSFRAEENDFLSRKHLGNMKAITHVYKGWIHPCGVTLPEMSLYNVL